jgi:hypothetical protein
MVPHQLPVKFALLCVATVVCVAPVPVSVTETCAVEVAVSVGTYCTPTTQAAPDASTVVAVHRVPVAGVYALKVPVPVARVIVGTAVNDTLPGPVFVTVTTPRFVVRLAVVVVKAGFGVDTVTALGAYSPVPVRVTD